MKKKQVIVCAASFIWIVNCGAYARDIYVNPATGNDSADANSTNTPFKTIAKAVELAGPGDTVKLGGAVFKGKGEHVLVSNKSGLPGMPITIDGQDALIDGGVPLDVNQWQQVEPGLYKNLAIFQTLLHKNDGFVGRFSFIFNGKLNRMGHSLKTPPSPYKKPGELKPGEWTYQKDEGTYYIKIDPAKSLADCNIEMPAVTTGVQVYGAVNHVVFRNITVTHVLNDGFALTIGDNIHEKIRDILFENIKSIGVCDDGLSPHGDCEIQIRGFLADDCSTGLAAQGDSVCERITTRNIHGADIYLLAGKHVIRNSYLDCTGRLGSLILTVYPNPYGFKETTLELDNVFVKGNNLEPNPLQLYDKSNTIQIDTKGAGLSCKNVTMCGLSINASTGTDLRIENSIMALGPKNSIKMGTGVNWTAKNNIYDLASIIIDKKTYTLADFEDYKQASQDKSSRWKSVDFTQPPKIPGIGADMSAIGSEMHKY